MTIAHNTIALNWEQICAYVTAPFNIQGVDLYVNISQMARPWVALSDVTRDGDKINFAFERPRKDRALEACREHCIHPKCQRYLVLRVRGMVPLNEPVFITQSCVASDTYRFINRSYRKWAEKADELPSR